MGNKQVITTVNGVPTGETIEGPVTVRHGEPVTVEPFEHYWQARLRFAELVEERTDCEVWIGDHVTDSWSRSYDEYTEVTFLQTQGVEEPE